VLGLGLGVYAELVKERILDTRLSLKAASHFCVTYHNVLLGNEYKPNVTDRGDHVW